MLAKALPPALFALAFAALLAWRLSADDAPAADAPAAEAPAPVSGGQVSPARGIDPNVHRSPVDLVVGPDETWLVAANQTSHSVSLVRLADGRVLDELPVGRRPTTLALHPRGDQVLVACTESGEVWLVDVAEERLRRAAVIATGWEPYGLAIAPDGGAAYVSLHATGEVAVLDLATRAVAQRIEVGAWPRHLALSPQGDRLAVGLAGERGIAVVDTRERALAFRETFGALNVGHLQASADGRHAYFAWTIYRNNPPTPGNIRLGWVLASRLGRAPLDAPARREAISLDPPGKAVADGHGVALTSDESHVVMSMAGTHELLVLRRHDLPFLQYGDPDHIDADLLRDRERFARIEVGGRPLAVRLLRDDRTALVANYLLDAVQEVDLAERRVVRSLALGGPELPGPQRRGEAVFFDARRSLDQWYSCHSCHFDGGSNAEPMDTLNDGTRFTNKTVLPLFRVTETAPWTWHGWQRDFDDALVRSFTGTMQGPAPPAADLADLTAYLRALDPPRSPFLLPDGQLSPAAQRGRAVFQSDKAGCVNCHNGPHYTDGQIHDVGLGVSTDRYKGFNTPTLLGVYRKTRLLHDGRARSLDQLLTGPHNPAKVVGQGDLTDDERRDLIEYLRTL